MTSSWSAATRARAAAATRTLERCRPAVIGSPRLSSALPPRAMTIRMGLGPLSRASGAERRDHDGLDGVHPVLRLVPDDRPLGLEDVVRDLKALHPEALVHLLADLGLPVVEGRQAVHELDGRVAGLGDQVAVDLVWRQELDALIPHGGILTHRDPDIGVQEVDALHALIGVVGQGDPRTGLLRPLSTPRDEFLVR